MESKVSFQSPGQIDEFITRQKELLDLERSAFVKSKALELKELGNTLKVKVVGTCVPKYGGTIVSFKSLLSKSETKFPAFKTGNLVCVDLGDGSDMLNGILVGIRETTFDVHLKDSTDVFKYRETYELVKTNEEGGYEQLELALDGIKENKFKLRNILFGLCQPSDPSTAAKSEQFALINKTLDGSQRAAVEFANGQKELAVIHGPPGTGKTTTLVEIICQAVKKGEKVLFSAPSNVAVDNIAERLANQGVKVVRIGHPARVAEHVLTHSLDVMLLERIKIVKDTEAKIRNVRIKLEKQCLTAYTKNITNLEEEMKITKKQLNVMKKRLNHQMTSEMSKADVVLGTLIGCGTRGPLKFLPDDHFQLTVIDECTQALEMSCWIVIPRSPKLILAGDHHQLAPTIFNKMTEKELSLSLMERLWKINQKSVIKMLTVQYRMNSLIMKWSSSTFYEGKVFAATLVAEHKLSDLGHVTKCGLTDTVLMMIDTAGKGMEESKSASKVAPSFANLGEAAVVVHHVKSLVQCGVKPGEIAIVTPYSLQVDLLSTNLLKDYPELEIKSVDGFQGREKEVVILSMVRSNQRQNLGFLADNRRLNVGVTRARRQLVLVCDSQTVSKDESIRSFVNYVRKRGKTQTPSRDIDISTLVGPRDLTVLIGKGKIPVLIRQAVKENVLKARLKHEIKLHDVVGMDCEMVGVGEDGEESKLARVSIVNHLGKVLLDTFVSVTEPVTDYRTEFSGVRQEDLEGAPDFETVRNKVISFLKGKTLVGHGLDHDMEVLSLYLNPRTVRDTSKYREFLLGGKTPSLKSLAAKYLGLKIQIGEHSSVEDARAAMNLYLKFMKEWEHKARNTYDKGECALMRSDKKKQQDEKFTIKTSNRYAELATVKPLPQNERDELENSKDEENIRHIKRKQTIKDKHIKEDNAAAYNVSGHEIIRMENLDNAGMMKKRTSNKTQNGTMKTKRKNKKQLENSKSLVKLSKNHHFLKKEFPSFFWERCICRKRTCSLTIRKAETRIEWAGIWLKLRDDRLDSPNFDNNLLIHDAFNNLSNRQLENWKQSQEERLGLHLMHIEDPEMEVTAKDLNDNEVVKPSQTSRINFVKELVEKQLEKLMIHGMLEAKH